MGGMMFGLTENDLRFARAAGYRIPWDRVREQLEPERPKIHVTLSTLYPTTNINDLFDKFTPTKEDMDKMFESRRRMAKEHEACLFGFALVHKVWKFYEVSFDVDNSDREKGIFRIDHYYKYFLHKNEARAAQKKYCGSFTKWNFKQLATMSDDEFEEISYTHGKNMNYELVKEWRQVIKEKI
jgi:hypothetical protein